MSIEMMEIECEREGGITGLKIIPQKCDGGRGQKQPDRDDANKNEKGAEHVEGRPRKIITHQIHGRE